MRQSVTHRALLCLVAMLPASAGCGKRTERQAVEQPPSWLVVGVSLCTTDGPWRAQMKADIEAAAAKHSNLRLAIMDAQDDADRQQAQLEEFLARRADVVIVSPKDAQAMTEPVAKLFDAGIPVIVLDRAVIGDKYTCFIAADPKQIGAAAGKWLAGRLQGKGKIVDIRGPVDSLPAEELARGISGRVAGPRLSVRLRRPRRSAQGRRRQADDRGARPRRKDRRRVCL